jgi:DHA2 family methylenomycin A resistance protein-like MFS transporter
MRPPRPVLHPWLVVLALAPGIFLTLADATVMSVAVPLIIRRLEGSVISVSWVMNGYNLVLTVLFLTMGRLADRYGHKLLFVLGLALFSAASVGCALAGTVDALIAWRVVQAVGAAAVVPTALALLLQAFPDERQGFAAGLFGALSSAAAAAGPVLGGVLIQRWGWPAVFWFNIPVGALSVALALALVRRPAELRPAAEPRSVTELRPTPGPRPTVARNREPLDWPGVGLVSAGLFCLTLAIIQGNDWGWASGVILGLFAAAAAVLAVWIWWELRTPSPLFDLRLFGRRTFAGASAAIMTVDTALMGTMFMLVIFMIAMMDYTEQKAGLVIAVVPAAVLVLTPLAGRLTDRVGPRVPAVAGALVAAAGLVALGYLGRSDPLWSVLWRSALVGAGIGLSLPALLAAGMSVVPGGVKGAGSGMLNTARQLGFLLGVAILVAVFAHTMNGAVNSAADAGQALVRGNEALSAPVRDKLAGALDEARTIDATAGIGEIRRIAHPIAEDIGQDVGFFEGIELLKLKDVLENLLWDEVSAAFRWPFFVAAIAAALGALAGAFLPRRLSSSQRPQA